MRTLRLGPAGPEAPQVPVIGVGCMRIADLTAAEADRFVGDAVDAGLTFFDHADIYGEGRCEQVFAAALARSSLTREQVQLQSKCGIRPGVAFDFSYEHIIAAVTGSLSRLRTDHLDVLLLHRPDALVEPEEVARAFDELASSGRVRHFGISNQNPGQIELLRRYVRQPLVANQLRLSVASAGPITAGLEVNMPTAGSVDRDGGVLDYCRLHDITVQPWSPFQYGYFDGVFIGSDRYPELNEVLAELAERYAVTPTTIAVAWLLRHPADLQPITGTTNPDRLRQCAAAADVRLTREEWYRLYLSAGNILP